MANKWNQRMKTLLHSIIVPVYNSQDTLNTLVERVSKVMREAEINFELILVDDGSQDATFQEVRRLSKLHSFIRGFRLSRNFGHQACLTIGLREGRGEFMAIIDDDLQDPPEMLPDFFSRLYTDADVVYGIRTQRPENFLKRFAYAAFYRILKVFSDVDMPLDSGDFCAMKRQVVQAMLRFQDANPFLRGIRAWVGFTQVGIKYRRKARIGGEPSYTLRKYFNLALSGILSFSYAPLRFATLLGICAAAVGFLFAAYVTCLWFIKPFEVSGYASLVVLITFLGGVQLITIGILGEYLARLSENARRRPVAIVAESTSEEERP